MREATLIPKNPVREYIMDTIAHAYIDTVKLIRGGYAPKATTEDVQKARRK